MDVFVLADPVGTVDRLLLSGRVPPRVHNKHIVCFNEGEADAASFEGDEEDWFLSGFERADDSVAASRAAIQIGVRNLRLLKPGRDPCKIAREL